MGRIRAGVSGWNYAAWRGGFYPADLDHSDELSYAAERFDTIEVNGTFYGLSTPNAFRRWYRAAPDGFVYTIKGSRFITHNKKLAGVENALANFLASGLLDLDDKLGPILWQLPGQLHFDAPRIDAFLDLLPRDTDAAADLARRHDDRIDDVSFGSGTTHRMRHVLEVRHDSYLCDEMVSIARDHGVALAFSNSARWPYLEEVTAGFVYVRLHGPGTLYESAYGEADLERWADRFETWRRSEQPDDAATITTRKPPARKERDVYVYFDNDGHGHAPREAAYVREILGSS